MYTQGFIHTFNISLTHSNGILVDSFQFHIKYQYRIWWNCKRPLIATRQSCSLRLQLTKATVFAESSLYFIFSPGSFCSSNVYRHESGRCRTLPFFLTFIISPFQVFLFINIFINNYHKFP